MSEGALKLDHVWFSYEKEPVLHDITMTIKEHEIAAIVGPNGGGKTTLLRLFLGQHQPSRGTVSVLGMPPKKARRFIGYVPQHIDLDARFPISTGEVVLMGRLGTRLLGRYRTADHDAARRALDDVGLSPVWNESFFSLSGSQRQRALIARALAVQPRILLLDEPTSSVDKEVSLSIYQRLAELSRDITVIFVSHDIHFVSSIVSQVLCVNKTAQLHDTADVPEKALEAVYGKEMAMVLHERICGNEEHGHG